jgi:membrane dipeptidase
MNRRDYLYRFGSLLAGIGVGSTLTGSISFKKANMRNPLDYIIVEGHRDIWEFNDRFALRDPSQHSPLKDFLLPRLLEGGVNVVIMPAGGDSVPERGGSDYLLKGSMQVIDMLLTEIEKTEGKASLILNRNDIPAQPERNHVYFFLDHEGGASIQTDPEPDTHPDRNLSILRNFFRLGVRGMQLTHNARNQLADGIGEGKIAGKLSKFGVEVVKEMNRLGMMIGVSHLSANGIYHTAELTSHPIVSTHTNLQKFINTPRQHSDEEIKAIAGTGGIIGIRYIVNETSYDLLADEVEYLANLVGVEHIGIGWLGHDAGHPEVGFVPGFSKKAPPTEFEGQTMYEHWEQFIRILGNRGFSEEDIALIVGGNYLRIWKDILPE